MSCILVSFCVFTLVLLRVEVSGFVFSCRWEVKRATSPSAQGRHKVGAGAGERSRWALRGEGSGEENSNRYEIGGRCSRGDLLHSLGLAGSAIFLGQALSGRPDAVLAKEVKEELPMVGKITKNGVKYFEYRVGDGESPRWGQACVVRFVMYGRPQPGAKLEQIESSDTNGEPYLFKHGNGQQIKGMEEGVHSMRVGGKRRIIIPRELGYTVPGLGPYPASSRNRGTLNKMLDAFEKSPGELVMDVELLDAFDDEADQGYYEDETPTLEELQQIMDDTAPFSTSSFELLPGQTRPAEDLSSSGSSPPPRLSGQLGEEIDR